MDMIKIESGCGKYSVALTAMRCGNDLNVSVTGGTSAHIGAVSLAVYEPERASATVSTLCVYTHRDDVLSRAIAKELSSRLGCTVCVSAGIHIDDASPQDILTLRENAMDCCRRLAEAGCP